MIKGRFINGKWQSGTTAKPNLNPSDYHVPFGGVKGSNYGPREQGSYAREFYTTVKTVYVA